MHLRLARRVEARLVQGQAKLAAYLTCTRFPQMNCGLPNFLHHAIHGEKQHTSVTDRLVLVFPLNLDHDKFVAFHAECACGGELLLQEVFKQMNENLHQNSACFQRIVLETWHWPLSCHLEKC